MFLFPGDFASEYRKSKFSHFVFVSLHWIVIDDWPFVLAESHLVSDCAMSPNVFEKAISPKAHSQGFACEPFQDISLNRTIPDVIAMLSSSG
jgi:hypothetical protein